jgi:hydrogenase/urease accessory protein HupE
VVRRLLLGLAFALLVLWPALALAHDEMISSSHVDVGERSIVWKVDVGLDGLRKALPLPERDLDESELENRRELVARYLMEGVVVTVNERTLPGEAGRLEPLYEPSLVTGEPRIARVALEMRFISPDTIRSASARVKFFSELTSQHRALVTIRNSGQAAEVVRLGPSDVSLASDRATSPQGATRATSVRWEEARDFLAWGIRHIFSGYDHIAFLLGLLLATAVVRDVVKIVTSFTVAHSVTLLLSALQVVRLPSRLTESLIALSIVYVAAENIFGQKSRFRHRWLVAFGFGLVHGLGFATDLRERLAESGRVVLPVLSFNVGVEVGQLAIVAMALPLLGLLRNANHAWAGDAGSTRYLRLGSLPILGLGIFWLVQRGLS